MKETRICRKCRHRKGIDQLQKDDKYWFCIEPCVWHDGSGKPRDTNKKDSEFDAILDAFKPEADDSVRGEIQQLQEELAVRTARLAELTRGFDSPLSSRQSYSTPTKKVFVIACAVSGALVHKDFLACLESYRDFYGGELRVIPLDYSVGDDEWYDDRIVPYLAFENLHLNSNLISLGTIKVLPTAARPLSGFESFAKESSIILAHPKVEMKLVANPKGKLPKMLVTTGAVTLEKYSDSKAGQKAQFHHSLSALVVEVENEHIFHVRHLHFDGEGTQDLDRYFYPDGRIEKRSVEAIVQGDTHVGFTDGSVLNATFFNKNSLVKVLKPKTLVWHDLMDFYACNHHHGVFEKVAKVKSKANNIQDELALIVKLFTHVDGQHKCQHAIVGSNHNDAFTRWVKENDWKSDPTNAETYLETALAIVQSARVGLAGAEYIGAFEYWMRKLLPASLDYRLISRGESFTIKGIELGFHGDRGANGSRGTPSAFAKSGSKFIIGHSHTPNIVDGCYQTGTSTLLNLEYTSGSLSSWLNSHVIIYPSGKRTHVHIIEGKYSNFIY